MSKHEDFGKYLSEKYPNLFKRTLWIECNQGWYGIIEALTQNIISASSSLKEDSMRVVQIKEKFGGLRYYIDYEDMSDDQIHKIEQLVREAESQSYKVCEDCGDPAEICSPRKYWMKTICIACRSKYDMGDTPNGI